MTPLRQMKHTDVMDVTDHTTNSEFTCLWSFHGGYAFDGFDDDDDEDEEDSIWTMGALVSVSESSLGTENVSTIAYDGRDSLTSIVSDISLQQDVLDQPSAQQEPQSKKENETISPEETNKVKEASSVSSEEACPKKLTKKTKKKKSKKKKNQISEFDRYSKIQMAYWSTR